MQSEKRLICEVDSAVSAPSKRSKTDEPRFRCSKCFRLGCTNIPCTGPGSKWYFSYSGLAFLLCSSCSHTRTEIYPSFNDLITIRFPRYVTLSSPQFGCTLLCRFCLSAQKDCLMQCKPGSGHEWFLSNNSRADFFREEILQTYDRIAKTFPDGKITPSQESQALSQLQTRLHHLVSRAAQLFGMEILLLFNKPAPRTVK